MGSHHRSAIATLIDRCTRQLILVQLPSKSAEAVTAAHQAIHRTARCSAPDVDLGPGQRAVQPEQLAAQTGLEVFFCDPASPCQRPMNANDTGLLRQYSARPATSACTPPTVSSTLLSR